MASTLSFVEMQDRLVNLGFDVFMVPNVLVTDNDGVLLEEGGIDLFVVTVYSPSTFAPTDLSIPDARTPEDAWMLAWKFVEERDPTLLSRAI
ncbi:hypothetical protein BCO18175_07170 [Burkholderia contaminans]|uniref:hypothetical protein n=1 Tax=Burkholderia contaminans TaxID=488447 RepID=UPI001453F2AD|nr:hypothetical protein [Burkholderia contaminans]VWD44860.1 hypothetical protein BCO18175_07170 [Burkholderia contaminans]